VRLIDDDAVAEVESVMITLIV
jgi:hypothetical protein